MRAAGDTMHGLRLRGLIVVLWRAGLRISEALALSEADLDSRPRRRVGASRQGPPPARGGHGRLGVGSSCTLADRSGRASCRAAVLRDHRSDARPALVERGRAHSGARHRGGRRRAPPLAPHQLRHAHAVELAHEGVPLAVIQRQLGHSNLGITSVYLQGIDNAEIIETVHARHAPMIPVSASLRL
jgi:integrase